MKNIFKLFTLIFIAVSFLISSCDELNKLILNVPLIIEFSSVGPNSSTSDSDSFCLTDYSDWRENQNDIESAKFLAASYWTLKEGTSPNLSGDVSVSLFDANNNNKLIFTYSLGNIVAAAYVENPAELKLNKTQIQALDDVLSGMADNNACFTASINVTNITGDKIQGDFVLNAKVEIVVETEVKTN